MTTASIAFQPAKGAEPIPGYVLGECIGSGGYGEVWKAVAPGGLIKAIKFVHGCIEDKWAARELRSLELVKTLNHPFLLNLERIEIVDGQLMIVSEMADMSLKEKYSICRQSGQAGIPRDELIEYLGEAAEALDYLQEICSFQHLDVKPENILLVGRHVKVADFGLLKDLNDLTSPIAGGMTPKYAAPEVFDGRPSRQSDQYSLALVYYELATGEFPFHGHNPAALASQHLHCEPRLDRLAAAERFAVRKALSKDPSRRFDSCSELVTRLRCRAAASVFTGDAEISSCPQGTMDGSRFDQAPASGGHAVPSAEIPVGETHDGHTVTVTFGKARSLPAMDLGGQAAKHRPSIFIGLGGTGGRVLCRLRQILQDAFGDAPLPSLQFLLIDTDSRAIETAVSGTGAGRLLNDETLLAPLRSGWTYRSMPLGDLHSLSRRWLYSVPRSLHTEGIRTFGRIAFLDHSKRVLQRLRTIVSAATSREAAAATRAGTGLPYRGGDPRVFVVASIGGGTGGGMLIDVSYALRQVLAEAGFVDKELCGLLAYTTARGKKAPCLETAGAYACLDELRYFCSPEHDYPGERACGLFGLREDRAALSSIYLVEMDGVAEHDRYAEQIDHLARYLFLNTASPASLFFDCCRARERRQQGNGRLSLRAFGVLPLAFDGSKIDPAWIESICAALILRWQGSGAGPAGDRASAASTGEPTAQSRDPRAELDDLAARQAAAAGIDAERLADQIKLSVGAALGCDLDQFVGEFLAKAAADCQQGGIPPAQMRAVLLDRIQGASDDAGRCGSAIPSMGVQLRRIAAAEARRLADAHEDAIGAWLLDLAEHLHGRIAGASGVAERFLGLLEALRNQADQRLQALRAERARAASELSDKGGGRCRKRQPVLEGLLSDLADYGRLVAEEIVIEAVGRAAGHLRSSAKAWLEKLHELSRLVGQIGGEFRTKGPAGAPDERQGHACTGHPLCMDSVAHAFVKLQREMLDQLDRQVQSSFFSSQCRLGDLLGCEKTIRDKLIARMRAAARKIVLSSLATAAREEVETALRASRASGIGPQLDGHLQAVASGPIKSGGVARRLFLTGPDAAVLAKLRGRLQQAGGEEVTIAASPEPEILLCCEAEELDFETIAARLMSSQPDCKELASRLHTRIDIDWT